MSAPSDRAIVPDFQGFVARCVNSPEGHPSEQVGFIAEEYLQIRYRVIILLLVSSVLFQRIWHKSGVQLRELYRQKFQVFCGFFGILSTASKPFVAKLRIIRQ